MIDAFDSTQQNCHVQRIERRGLASWFYQDLDWRRAAMYDWMMEIDSPLEPRQATKRVILQQSVEMREGPCESHFMVPACFVHLVGCS